MATVCTRPVPGLRLRPLWAQARQSVAVILREEIARVARRVAGPTEPSVNLLCLSSRVHVMREQISF